MFTTRPHSEQGARKGEHRGRSSNPVIKVQDLAWLEFQKPDLVRAEAFAHAFGFTTVSRSGDELELRGSDPGSPCVLIRRGPTSRFIGTAFIAADEADIRRLADANGAATRALPETIGGLAVDLVDPSGMPVRVVAGMRSSKRCRLSRRRHSTSGPSCGAPTQPSGHPDSPPGCNDSDMSSCRRPGISNRLTGTSISSA